MERAGCSGISAAIVSPRVAASSPASAITSRVREQARSTPASPCLPSCVQSAASSFRMESGATVVLILWFPPYVAAPGQHLVGGGRPPTSGGIVGKIGFSLPPGVLDRLHHAPAGLHHILARIECGVANDGV